MASNLITEIVDSIPQSVAENFKIGFLGLFGVFNAYSIYNSLKQGQAVGILNFFSTAWNDESFFLDRWRKGHELEHEALDLWKRRILLIDSGVLRIKQSFCRCSAHHGGLDIFRVHKRQQVVGQGSCGRKKERSTQNLTSQETVETRLKIFSSGQLKAPQYLIRGKYFGLYLANCFEGNCSFEIAEYQLLTYVLRLDFLVWNNLFKFM